LRFPTLLARASRALGFEQGFHSREKRADNPPQVIVSFG
jgi:hypothetical protein